MQKKLIFLLVLTLFTGAQIFSFSGKQKRDRCCDLGTLAYKAISKIGITQLQCYSYHTLAVSDSAWWLRKK